MPAKDANAGLRTMMVHFSGGTEISLQTATSPAAIYAALEEAQPWLVVEDHLGERHYLAVGKVAYLTFAAKKGVGFGL
jgi:hypothetical protein